MTPDQIEERRRAAGESCCSAGFDLAQHCILVGGGERTERFAAGRAGVLVERGQTGGVRLTGRSERAAEGVVDVTGRASLECARASRVARNQAGDNRVEKVAFGAGEMFEWPPHQRASGARRDRGAASAPRASAEATPATAPTAQPAQQLAS